MVAVEAAVGGRLLVAGFVFVAVGLLAVRVGLVEKSIGEPAVFSKDDSGDGIVKMVQDAENSAVRSKNPDVRAARNSLVFIRYPFLWDGKQPHPESASIIEK